MTDAVGSNIRVDSRGVQVMRVLPRTNDNVNEEWISDKTRFSYDGLRFQRLTTPLVKQGDRFIAATWQDALTAIANGLAASGAKGDEIRAVAGHLADTESLVALKDLVNRLGSDNLTLDQVNGDKAPAHGVDVRSNYLFNSTIPGLEEADAILLVGTNPRHEAAVLNSRIRKSWLHTGLEIGLVGERVDTAYGYDYIGSDAKALSDFVAGKGPFVEKFKAAKKPLIIVGSAVNEHADGAAVFHAIAKYVEANKSKLLTPEWNGLNILQRVSQSLRLGLRSTVLNTFRSHLALPPTMSALCLPKRHPKRSPNSSIYSTPMKLIPSPFLKTPLSFTKVIMVT